MLQHLVKWIILVDYWSRQMPYVKFPMPRPDNDADCSTIQVKVHKQQLFSYVSDEYTTLAQASSFVKILTFVVTLNAQWNRIQTEHNNTPSVASELTMYI